MASFIIHYPSWPYLKLTRYSASLVRVIVMSMIRRSAFASLSVMTRNFRSEIASQSKYMSRAKLSEIHVSIATWQANQKCSRGRSSYHDRRRHADNLSRKVFAMKDAENFLYETRLNIYYQPLEIIEEKALADASTYKWYNQTLCQVNASVVRLGVIEGEYHWHKHDDDDEFFYVVEGELLIDLEYRTVTLQPRQGFVVPKGVQHRTRAPKRTVILMVENAGIIPTGN